MVGDGRGAGARPVLIIMLDLCRGLVLVLVLVCAGRGAGARPVLVIMLDLCWGLVMVVVLVLDLY